MTNNDSSEKTFSYDLGSSAHLLAALPPIRRARGYRLYLEGGQRLVDLWQLNGAAILGHTPPRLLLALKDSAARGLFAPFPHPDARRLEKALLRFAPTYTEVRIYASRAEAEAALAVSALAPITLNELTDPALTDAPQEALGAFWRPWTGSAEEKVSDDGKARLFDLLVPILPLPWPSAPVVFLLSGSVAKSFPASAFISPLLLSALSRSLADLLGSKKRRAADTLELLPKTAGALHTASEQGLWARRGIYVNAGLQEKREDYAALFNRFLKAGFLLPPDPAFPIILPGELSLGEDATLAALIKTAEVEIL